MKNVFRSVQAAKKALDAHNELYHEYMARAEHGDEAFAIALARRVREEAPSISVPESLSRAGQEMLHNDKLREEKRYKSLREDMKKVSDSTFIEGEFCEI